MEVLLLVKWAILAYAFFAMFIGGIFLILGACVIYHMVRAWKA